MDGRSLPREATSTTALILASFFAVLAPHSVRAATPPGEQIFESSDCATCHAIDHKVVGPALQDIAKKFAGQNDAAPTLADAIKNGHVGTWGQIPMPPDPTLTDAQIQQVVAWILTLK
jgi:cytochrome c